MTPTENIPVIIILFGGSGDLAHRKLYPALFNLYQQNVIHDRFAVIGTARRPWSHDYLREQIKESIEETHDQVNEDDLKHFLSHFYYQSHDVTHVSHYMALKKMAAHLDETYHADGNRIFYMAMAPRFFGTIATHINDQHLIGSGFNRLVVEKPFGRSLASAQKLNDEIRRSFSEDQVYRIDHYLGKEMVQNILPLRLTNPLIKNVWNHDFVKNIQITLGEQLGVEARGGYYETSGALRDMVQNHVFQIATLLMMPEPEALSATAIHAAKQMLLDHIVLPDPDQMRKHFVRGQYLGNDDTFAYRKEKNVAPDSTTETFAAGEIKFNAGPLAGVPVYFRTGKRMKEKCSRVDIVLKHMTNLYGRAHSNNISIIIDPVSEFYLTINGKKIQESGIRREDLKYRFTTAEMAQVPDGYERLLHDVFVADTTNFTHWSELKRSWQFIDAAEAFWQSDEKTVPMPQYAPFKMGPKEADHIFENPHDHWIYR